MDSRRIDRLEQYQTPIRNYEMLFEPWISDVFLSFQFLSRVDPVEIYVSHIYVHCPKHSVREIRNALVWSDTRIS